MFEITPLMKQLAATGCYLAINIVLLTFYTSLPSGTNTSNFDGYKGLSIAGNIFMMIGFLSIVAMHFKYLYYGALGIVVTMNLGLFLLLIGMGLGSEFYKYLDYNAAVAFWFIHLAIDVLGMQILLKVHKDNQGNAPEPAPVTKNVAQPQVQS